MRKDAECHPCVSYSNIIRDNSGPNRVPLKIISLTIDPIVRARAALRLYLWEKSNEKIFSLEIFMQKIALKL